MTSTESFPKVSKTARQCNFPNKEAEEKAIRDVMYRGMNSQRVRDKCINSYNNGEEISIQVLLRYLEVEDSNTRHKSLGHLDFTTSANYMHYDQRQNKENKHTKNQRNEKPMAQKHGEGSRINNF